MQNAVASVNEFNYGLISRRSAEYLGMAPAVAGGGVVTVPWTLSVEKSIPASEGGGSWNDKIDGYMAKLPHSMGDQYFLVETNEAEYLKAVEHAQWLEQQA